jgi:hypothetical protein
MNAIHARSQLRYWPTLEVFPRELEPYGIAPADDGQSDAELHRAGRDRPGECCTVSYGSASHAKDAAPKRQSRGGGLDRRDSDLFLQQSDDSQDVMTERHSASRAISWCSTYLSRSSGLIFESATDSRYSLASATIVNDTSTARLATAARNRSTGSRKNSFR